MSSFSFHGTVRPPRSASEAKRVQILAPVLAVIQLATIAAELVTASAFEPSYNWVKNTISELGVAPCTTDFDAREHVEACSPLADVMNVSMMVSGLALLLLAISLRHSRGFAGVPGILWIIAGVGSIVTGFVTLDTSPVAHQLVSMPLFFGGPLAILTGAFQLQGRPRTTGIALGVCALVLGVVFSTSDLVYGFGGIVERLVIWPSLVWVVYLTFAARRAALAQPRNPTSVAHYNTEELDVQYS